jgi:hypothetical protein
VLSNGVVSLDPATREAAVNNGASVQLSNREFALLQALLVRPGAILSRSDLEDRIYGWGEEVESNAVEFLIHALRRKLGSEVIKNVRGWMDGFKKRLNESVQLKLSFSLSLAIFVIAVVAGIFSFVSAFDEAHELQDDMLRQVRRCLIGNTFRLHILETMAAPKTAMKSPASSSNILLMAARRPGKEMQEHRCRYRSPYPMVCIR